MLIYKTKYLGIILSNINSFLLQKYVEHALCIRLFSEHVNLCAGSEALGRVRVCDRLLRRSNHAGDDGQWNPAPCTDRWRLMMEDLENTQLMRPPVPHACSRVVGMKKCEKLLKYCISSMKSLGFINFSWSQTKPIFESSLIDWTLIRFVIGIRTSALFSILYGNQCNEGKSLAVDDQAFIRTPVSFQNFLLDAAVYRARLIIDSRRLIEISLYLEVSSL